MEDFFYFTRSTVTFVEITEVADEFQYEHEFFQSSNDFLNIYITNSTFWQLTKITEEEGDFESFEPSDRTKVEEFNPSSSFMISCHLNSLEKLALFLKRLLEKYGGWIGTDLPDFEPIYELSNIDKLPALTRASYEV